MSRKVRQDYLSLLRCALWDGDFPPAPRRTRAVLRLADAQKTVPLIGDVLHRAGYPLTDKAAEKVAKRIVAAQRLNTDLDREGEAILQEWAEAGITGILLKGQSLARCYPRPHLRVCGDIDFYVQEADYRHACKLVFRREDLLGDVRIVDEGEKHLCLKRDHVIVEVHRRALILRSPEKDARWQEIEAEGLKGSAPERTFNALYIFLHAWEHFGGNGLGVRQLCDWALFLHKNAGELDLTKLQAWLSELDLMDPWQVFGALAVNGLGLPASEMPFYDLHFRRRGLYLLRLILREGNFGRNRPARKNRSKWSRAGKKIRTALSIPARALKLLPVFPSLSLSYLRNGLADGFRKL